MIETILTGGERMKILNIKTTPLNSAKDYQAIFEMNEERDKVREDYSARANRVRIAARQYYLK